MPKQSNRVFTQLLRAFGVRGQREELKVPLGDVVQPVVDANLYDGYPTFHVYRSAGIVAATQGLNISWPTRTVRVANLYAYNNGTNSVVLTLYPGASGVPALTPFAGTVGRGQPVEPLCIVEETVAGAFPGPDGLVVPVNASIALGPFFLSPPGSISLLNQSPGFAQEIGMWWTEVATEE